MSGAFAEGSAERYISAHVPRIRPYRVTFSPSLIWTPTLIFMTPVLRCVKRGLSGRW
jgi:hypothetical protein